MIAVTRKAAQAAMERAFAKAGATAELPAAAARRSNAYAGETTWGCGIDADFLFDRGFVSFSDGRLLISDVADPKTLLKLGVDPDRSAEVGAFNDEQERFLEFHRREIFRKAV
jgi:hypothetical protein